MLIIDKSRTSSPDMRRGEWDSMNSTHRVEALYHGQTDRFEFWQDPSARVRFFRRVTGSDWVATIDGRLITDGQPVGKGLVRTASMNALRAASAEELIPLVAIQEQVHGVMVPGQSWGGGHDATWMASRDAADCFE